MRDKFINDNYDFIRKLGKGAFGSVYLVTKKNDSKKIALKKILVKKDKRFSHEIKLEKAKKEIEILKNIATPECSPNLSCYLNHHIVTQNKESIIYLEMEYINGKTLEEYILPFREEEDTENLLEIVYNY